MGSLLWLTGMSFILWVISLSVVLISLNLIEKQQELTDVTGIHTLGSLSFVFLFFFIIFGVLTLIHYAAFY
jgi:hypothetical protein